MRLKETFLSQNAVRLVDLTRPGRGRGGNKIVTTLGKPLGWRLIAQVLVIKPYRPLVFVVITPPRRAIARHARG